MIIRHDINPDLYLTSPGQFPAVITVSSLQVEVQIAYDNIDQLIRPNLIPIVQTAPEYRTCCNGMGTLIRPDWVVSAAHIAAEIPLNEAIEIGGRAIAIQQIVLHPHFQNATLNKPFAENDIALIQLKQPIKSVSPLPLYRSQDEQQQQTVLMGRGDFGNGLTGPDQVDGKLRMATNRVEKVEPQWLLLKFDAPPESTELEGIAGPGDSGGPALLAVKTGWALAGVRSTQASGRLGEGYYGVWEYYTRISHYLNWIDSVIDA